MNRDNGTTDLSSELIEALKPIRERYTDGEINVDLRSMSAVDSIDAIKMSKHIDYITD